MESFEKLTPNRKHSDLLKQLYDDDIEKLDLLIGCLAEEPRPDGYGFGETAFNIFVLMASRRLKTDRLVISLSTFVHSAGALIIKGLNWKLSREMTDLSTTPSVLVQLHSVDYI